MSTVLGNFLFDAATHFSPRAMASFYSSSQGASGITRARSNAFVHLALRTCNILASFTWSGRRRVLDERARACMTEKRLGRTGATSSSNDHRPSLPVALAPPLLYRHSAKSIHRRHRRWRFPGKRDSEAKGRVSYTKMVSSPRWRAIFRLATGEVLLASYVLFAASFFQLVRKQGAGVVKSNAISTGDLREKLSLSTLCPGCWFGTMIRSALKD
ncbi:hypothetical protein C8J56DRAFT_1071308 [Mycena floridula]|nr:hypothetical protein C8J56DRAFT_1071308 [Mycena floridula]